MKLYNRRLLADKVLTLVRPLIRDLDDNGTGVTISLQSYQNGREQGHALNICTYDFKTTVWVAFAEYRNSDQVVVYVADRDPMQSVSDEAWGRRKMCDTPDEAAYSIMEIFCGVLKGTASLV